MFGFQRSRFGRGTSRAGLVRSSLGLEVLEGLALPSAVIPVPDAGPEVAAEVRASDYSAIAFVGGWGSSMYQYAHTDPAAGGVNVLMGDGSVRFLKDSINRAADDVIVDGRIITGENWNAAPDSDDRPTEEVAFYYNKIGVHPSPAAPNDLAAKDAPQAAHVDFYLKLEGVEGEATSANSGSIRIMKLNSGG